MGKSGKKKATKPSVDLDHDRFDSSKPQFRNPKDSSSKVVLDSRFSAVLTDPRFQLDIQDKYGRRNKKKTVKDDLSNFYTIDEEGEDKKKKEKRKKSEEVEERPGKESLEKDESNSEKEDDDEEDAADEDPSSRIAYLTALSRGQLDVSSSSSEDEDDAPLDDQASLSEDEDSVTEENDVYGKAGILDPSSRTEDDDVELIQEESRYLAVQNLDWTHVRAVDIFAILSSFTSAGAIRRVQVFTSDFGMERLAEEERIGPTGVWKKKKNIKVPAAEGDERDNADDSNDDDSDDNDSNQDESRDGSDAAPEDQANFVQSDFDPEKLRAYEASKLKYYFAVVEFADPRYADSVYSQVDGLEFEHSSAAMDLRLIPEADLDAAIKDRPLRDEASKIPSNYTPPDFVVSALQQTSVQCTWEMGDVNRDRHLTSYVAAEKWGEIAESDDLRAYLASDGSSDEEDPAGERGGTTSKAAKTRKLLGLDSDSEEDHEDTGSDEQEEDASSAGEESSDDNDEEGAESKEVRFVPGTTDIREKVAAKLEASEPKEELTPWEKFQERRKQKRKERKQAARERRKEVSASRKLVSDGSGYAKEEDGFFLHETMEEKGQSQVTDKATQHQRKEELELLLAGADEEAEARDYDMRGLQRIEKNKDKKLRGARKRKEAEAAASVVGGDFNVDLKDDRFKALLDGDDPRFGIDRTDPNFKETRAMQQVMDEQTRRRKAKRAKKEKRNDVAPNVSAESQASSAGSVALSALVSNIKSNMARRVAS